MGSNRLGVNCGLFIIFLASLVVLPVKFLLPGRMLLKKDFHPLVTKDVSKDALQYNGSLPGHFLNHKMSISIGPMGFPMIIHSPTELKSSSYNASAALIKWYEDNRDWCKDSVDTYGGILFRGFALTNPIEFDQVIAGIHSESEGTGVYLGTAPRKKIEGTRFVSSASEISGTAAIPVHLELCYTPFPPPRLYFFVEQLNTGIGGQTPLADFRQVWRDFPIDLKNKILKRGLLYKRRYYNEDLGKLVDPLQHKSWQAMFLTSNKSVVEEMSRSEGFDPHWDESDNLLLTHRAVIYRNHNNTNEDYWSTHFNVLHAGTTTVPLAYAAQILDDSRALLPYFVLSWMIYIRHDILKQPYGHDMVYGDDESEMSWNDAMTIRKLIYKNTWIFDWKVGDMLILDNHRIAHGRMPFYGGSRKVYVAWQ
jgi:alpha-ketoglutarate-dependent taurine dioxygenase